jgi:predicted nucleic acid-binding protein
MAYKIFLDINILIDFFDSKRLHHRDAVKLISMAEAKNCNASAYLVKKDYDTIAIKPVFTGLLAFTKIIPVDNFIYQLGIQYSINDLEDAVLYAAANQAKVDYFITNDLKDFNRLATPSLPIMQAKQFLTLVE